MTESKFSKGGYQRSRNSTRDRYDSRPPREQLVVRPLGKPELTGTMAIENPPIALDRHATNGNAWAVDPIAWWRLVVGTSLSTSQVTIPWGKRLNSLYYSPPRCTITPFKIYFVRQLGLINLSNSSKWEAPGISSGTLFYFLRLSFFYLFSPKYALLTTLSIGMFGLTDNWPWQSKYKHIFRMLTKAISQGIWKNNKVLNNDQSPRTRENQTLNKTARWGFKARWRTNPNTTSDDEN